MLLAGGAPPDGELLDILIEQARAEHTLSNHAGGAEEDDSQASTRRATTEMINSAPTTIDVTVTMVLNMNR